jgi:hypothetical protein
MSGLKQTPWMLIWARSRGHMDLIERARGLAGRGLCPPRTFEKPTESGPAPG